MLIIKKWRSDFVLNPFISAFDLFSYWFSFICNPYGRWYSKSRTRPSKILHEKHLSPWNKIFMSWLAGTLTAKSDDLAYAIRLVRSKPQSKVLPPCVFWDFYFGLSVKKVIQRSRVRKANQISQKRKQKRWLTNDGQSALNIPLSCGAVLNFKKIIYV